MDRPKLVGLRHIAIKVRKFESAIKFYRDVIGMSLELQTEDYAYLTTGSDNLSLHYLGAKFGHHQKLEHIGFLVDLPAKVDEWKNYMYQAGIAILESPKTFGVGTRSFSVADPDGNEVEFIYHPPMLNK